MNVNFFVAVLSYSFDLNGLRESTVVHALFSVYLFTIRIPLSPPCNKDFVKKDELKVTLWLAITYVYTSIQVCIYFSDLYKTQCGPVRY